MLSIKFSLILNIHLKFLDIQREKKSTNFLLMHNLDPEIGKINKGEKKEKRSLDKAKSNKKFQEDE